jgi:hypothetical protein
VVFSAGERRGGTVRLYYDAYGSFLSGQLADSWACVTLEEQPDGGYHFVSPDCATCRPSPRPTPTGTRS